MARKKQAHTHRSIQHFKVNEKEWRCCGCGKVGLWDEDWSYFGCIGCVKCGLELTGDAAAMMFRGRI